MKPEDLVAVSESIASLLAPGLTERGLLDPVEQRVIPHSYTTEHFAWQSSLLHSLTKEESWRNSAIRATEAALSIRRNSSKDTLKSNGQYHWEFKNLSLAFVLRTDELRLPTDLKTHLRDYIHTWDDLNIDSTNWNAMRAVSYRLRYLLLDFVRDLWRSNLELGLVLTKQTAEGFFPDRDNSYSFQYHAYTLALLALLIEECRVRWLTPRFLDGITLIAEFIDPDGDFNYFGRGQRQIFGYVSLVYALVVAASLAQQDAVKARYMELACRVFNFVDQHQPEGTWRSIVLNHFEEERLGWYDYNLAGDYLAFAGVYLLLAAKTLQNHVSCDRVLTTSPEPYIKSYPGLGLGVINTPGCFAVMSSISREPAEAFGLIHLWPAGETCFGGPAPNRACRDYSQNYIGPLDASGTPLLIARKGELNTQTNGLVAKVLCNNLEVEHQLALSPSSITYKQTITCCDSVGSCDLIPFQVASSTNPTFEPELVTHGVTPAPNGWKRLQREVNKISHGRHVSNLTWCHCGCHEVYKLRTMCVTQRKGRTLLAKVANRVIKGLWILVATLGSKDL